MTRADWEVALGVGLVLLVLATSLWVLLGMIAWLAAAGGLSSR